MRLPWLIYFDRIAPYLAPRLDVARRFGTLQVQLLWWQVSVVSRSV